MRSQPLDLDLMVFFKKENTTRLKGGVHRNKQGKTLDRQIQDLTIQPLRCMKTLYTCVRGIALKKGSINTNYQRKTTQVQFLSPEKTSSSPSNLQTISRFRRSGCRRNRAAPLRWRNSNTLFQKKQTHRSRHSFRSRVRIRAQILKKINKEEQI